MYIRLGGEWRTIQSCQIRANGAWRTVKQIKIYADGAWRECANFAGGGTGGTGGGSLTVAITAVTSGNRTDLTATPTNGVPRYTYAWSVVSGSASITSPARATTRITGSGSVTVRCDVTDSLGSTGTDTETLTL